MMSARLSSLLVAGGVVLAGIQPGFPNATTPASESTLRFAILQGATLETGNASEAIISLNIPEYAGKPKIQVLSHPNRIVLDLPGVTRGVLPTKKDMAGWTGSLIQRARLAQFVAAPEPVTRFVLEVAEGTQVSVSRSPGGIQVALQPGMGAIQATMTPFQALDLPATVTPELKPAEEPRVSVAAVPAIEVVEATPVIEPAALLVKAPSLVEAAALPPVPDMVPQTVASAPPPITPIPSIVPTSSQSPSNVALSTLLPATLSTAQEKAPAAAPVVRKEEPRGRTLGDVQGRYTGSRITIDVRGAELSTFLRIIADHAKLNLVADQDVQGIYDFKFTDTPWDQVLDIIIKHANLGMEISNNVIRVAKTEKLQKEEDDRKKLEESKALAGQLTTVTRPLSFAKASEAKAIIEKVLTKRGSLIIDERTNVLIVSDLPKNIPLIDDLVQQLDVQIQQVQIEARVVEANGGYQKAFGVKWPTSNAGDAKLSIGGSDAAWIATNSPSWNSINSRPTGTTTWAGGFAPGKDGVTSIAGAAGEFWVSFLSNRMSVNVILQALEKEGKIRIVSNPKVVTQNNKKATILSGAKIPYPTQQGGAAGGAITVAFADANLQLDVTPQITNDGTIIMDLKIEKAEADFSATVNGTPSILRKFIETQVLVRDGGTAVLGGIYTTTTNAQTTGVPFLSKIPIIGWLFRMKDNKETNTELLIFITPRVLKM